MAVVLPNGRNYFATSTGTPLVGGKVWTYQPGTSTPKATYTDSTGVTPNTNPIILNSRGEAAIYWTGAYDVVLLDSADALIWGPERLEESLVASDITDLTTDLLGLSANEGADLIGLSIANQNNPNTLGGFLQYQFGLTAGEIAAGVTPSNYAYFPGDIRRYGALVDGTTNDTTAVQAAIDVAFDSGGGVVFFPEGTCMVSALSLDWGSSPISIVFYGVGQRASVIKKRSGTTTSVFTLAATLGDGAYSEFRDLTIDADGIADHCISATLMARNVFRGVGILNATGAGFYAVGSLINSFYDCNMLGSVVGYQSTISGAVRCNLVEFFGGSIRQNTSWGLDIGDTSGLHLYGTDIEENGTTGNIGGGMIIRSNCGTEFVGANISINGVWFEANFGTSLWCEAATDLILRVRDTCILNPEGNRSMNIGAISAVILDGVWANGAAGTGDDTILAADSSSINDSALRILTDSSTKRQYRNSTIAGNLVEFQSISSGGTLAIDGPAVNSGFSNTAGVFNNTATTITTISGATPAMYDVFACLGGAGANFMANARLGWDGTNLTRMGGENGANMTITVSGANVQVTQTAGSTQTVAWFLLRIG